MSAAYEDEYQIDETGKLLPQAEKPEYATMNRRLMAISIDMFIAALPMSLLSPLLEMLSPAPPVAQNVAYDKLLTQGLTGTVDINAVGASLGEDWLWTFMINNTATTLLFIFYCLLFWHFWGNTPGKAILRCHIVDAKTLQMPTHQQFYKRLAGYLLTVLTLGFGFLIMVFSQRNQAWHDKIASTVVIRKR